MENEKNNMKLDDAQRVRVLSPGMMVAKRFFRNRLAIVGLVCLCRRCSQSVFPEGGLLPHGRDEEGLCRRGKN